MEKLELFSRDFKKLVDSSQNFLLIPHVGIDGDALGSLLAVREALKILKKRVISFTSDVIPDSYSFLPGADELSHEHPLDSFDCAILFECPNYSRSPAGSNFKASKVINIDHHPDNTSYGDLKYIDPAASSVGEIIFNLFYLLKYPITRDMALNLYVAIYSDTGGFVFDNTTSRTHLAISRLLEMHHLPLNEISRKIDREMDASAFQLLGSLMQNVKVRGNGFASAILTREMISRHSIKESDLQNFTQKIFQIKGVHSLAFLREGNNGEVKVSLRSNILPVNQIAAKFGGGGHPAAAGCTIDDVHDIYSAENSLLKAMDDFLKSGAVREA